MATEADSRFTSKFRKERIEARRERTERRNKAFDQRDGESRDVTSATSRVEISVRGTSSSSRAPKIDVGKSELETVTSKIIRLNLAEEKERETASHHEDEDDEEAERRKEKEHLHAKKERGAGATTSKKRQQKKNLREKRRSTGVVIMPNMEVRFYQFPVGRFRRKVSRPVSLREWSLFCLLCLFVD